MSRDRSSDRCSGSLTVTGLSNHDDIRVLTHQGTQSHIKGKPGNRINLCLVDIRQILFHRIFNRGNIDMSSGQIIQNHIKCR